MMRNKVWMPATLKEVGGTKGVGVTFLEETFSASTAPPEHRYHQKAARAVLKGLGNRLDRLERELPRLDPVVAAQALALIRHHVDRLIDSTADERLPIPRPHTHAHDENAAYIERHRHGGRHGH